MATAALYREVYLYDNAPEANKTVPRMRCHPIRVITDKNVDNKPQERHNK